MPVRDLLIVGAGPSGLSAAIAAKQRGLDYQVIEQGALVNSIYHFPPQMVFFTTPELLEIGGLPFVSPYEKPTRAEALKYYRKVVDTYDLQITFEETVLSVDREASDDVDRGPSLFALETRSAHGVRRIRHARNVVLAIGYYDHPNLLDVPGENLPHVHHYYGEPHPYYRRRVVIVGGGNSAAESALELHRAGAHVTLVHRWSELKSTIKYWVKPDIENRIKEGSIAARFNTCLAEICPTSVILTSAFTRGRESTLEADEQRSAEGEREPSAKSAGGGAPAQEEKWGPARIEKDQLPADAVFLLTGYHPDYDLLTRAGVSLNERGVPAYDPDTFETNVGGLFVAGGVISGKDTAPIFIENGRFHGEKIVEVISRRSTVL
jgi:thioredoxin reductase (NADPH)